MKGALLALLPFALFLASCETREVDEAGNIVEPEQVRSGCTAAMFEDTPFTHCIAEPERHAVHMVLAGPDGAPYRGLAAYAAARHADAPPVVFAMNAGMFNEDGEPIGYYVEEGERLAHLNQADGPGNFHMMPNGVFFGETSAEWRVWDTDRFADDVHERPDFGTQSGPMLVIAGELHPDIAPNGESLRIRNGVGVDEAGRAHFVISEAPVSFGRFARYFRDVASTPQALFLDGSVSQLWDPARGRLDAGAPIGPLIVVEMRENAP